MDIGGEAALTGLRDHDTQGTNDPEQCGAVQCLNGELTAESNVACCEKPGRWVGAPIELATLAFIDARENVLLIGRPDTSKSHAANVIALSAVQRGYKVLYREAHALLEEITRG